MVSFWWLVLKRNWWFTHSQPPTTTEPSPSPLVDGIWYLHIKHAQNIIRNQQTPSTVFCRCWRSGLSLFADAVAWRRVSPPSWSLDGCLFKVISEVFLFDTARKNQGVYKGLIVISHVFPSLIRGGYVGGMIGEPGGNHELVVRIGRQMVEL